MPFMCSNRCHYHIHQVTLIIMLIIDMCLFPVSLQWSRNVSWVEGAQEIFGKEFVSYGGNWP